MAEQTPSAGPAPVTYTEEDARRLVAEALIMAMKPDALLLPTRDHIRALVARMARVEADRAELVTLVVAVLRDQGLTQLVVPKAELAQVARHGLAMNDAEGLSSMRVYRVLAPPPSTGSVN